MNQSRIATVSPARTIRGELRLPGDKSISHRYALLAAIAEGRTRIENFAPGADCRNTVDCVQALGREVSFVSGSERGSTAVASRIPQAEALLPPNSAKTDTVEISGLGAMLCAPATALDCGNSGSTMRMLSGILAGQNFSAELRGDASLSRRPMGRIIEPLTAMGARISARNGNHPPLRIAGGNLKALDYKLPVASAQVKSAVLFAGLFAAGETWVEEPVQTRDHGEIALQAFGARVIRRKNRAGITGGQKLSAIETRVPGDISSAAFFLCAAALFPGAELVIHELLLNPTRVALLDALRAMGLRIAVLDLAERAGELVGSIRVEGGELRGTVISGAQSAALIDELPVLAAISPYTSDGIEIRDARELRSKESDRIAIVAKNLRAMGAEVEEREDGLRIRGQQEMHGAEIDSAGDHRIAMAFAVAALRARSDTLIKDADVVKVSYPTFFHELQRLTES